MDRMNDDKRMANQFLVTLQRCLEEDLPNKVSMRQQVDEMTQSLEVIPSLRNPEGAFLRGVILPKIHKALVGTFELSTSEARDALLMEGWNNFQEISSNTPARTRSHPFDKAFISDPMALYAKWSGSTKRHPLTQSCPDFALRPPCAHKIVFEAKYFTSESPTTAARELVTGLYQTFFYRALPPSYEDPSRPWDYDYACLIAFDGSSNGVLKSAWETRDRDVRSGFWEGANLYTMILG